MINLEVVTVSFGQFKTGAYTVLLKEKIGQRKIPITIGTSEAHSIILVLKQLKYPRPTIHDLFVSFAKALNISLKEVNIYKQTDGIFYSKIIFDLGKGKPPLSIDTKASDAIALALRFQKVSILTTEEVIEQSSIVLFEETDNAKEEEIYIKTTINPLLLMEDSSYKLMNTIELQKQLNKAIKNEDYEIAARLRDLISSIIKNK